MKITQLIAVAAFLLAPFSALAQSGATETLARDALQNLYVSLAISEHCEIQLGADIAALIGQELIDYEEEVGLSSAQSMGLYALVLEAVKKERPDCSEGSADTAKVRLMIEMFALRLL